MQQRYTKLKNKFIPFRIEPRFILLFIILNGILLRLPNLNESLWYDEIFSTHIHLPNLKALAYFGVFDVHPPFYSALMFFWTVLFGDSEISVRTLPMIFGISSIVLIYVLARHVADEETALLAAFLLSFSPVHIWYSQEARSYSALIFFLLLVVIARFKLDDVAAPRVWFFIYSAAAFAGVFSHYFFILYIFLISIILIVGNHVYKRRILAVNAAAIFFLSILVLIKFVKSAIKTEQSGWRAFSFLELKQLFFKWFLLGGNSWDAEKFYWWIIVIQLIFTAIFVRGVIYLLKKPNRAWGAYEIVLYLFCLPLFLLVTANFGQRGYIERSVITALPFFFIVIAAGATVFKNKIIRYVCISAIIVVSIATVALYYNRQDVRTVYKPNPDWRAAALYFKDEINAAPVVPEIFVITSADELLYYNPHFKLVLNKELEFNPPNQELQANFWVITEIRKHHLSKIYDKMVRDKKERFYLTHDYYWLGSFDNSSNNTADIDETHDYYWMGSFDKWLDQLKADPRFEYKEMKSFKGLNIYRFDLAQ